MKILLVNPPFCPPTMPPYSISYLKGFLMANLDVKVKCLDLNALFHRLRFPELFDRLNGKDAQTDEGYALLLTELESQARPAYSFNNKKVVDGIDPEFSNELARCILAENPDLVAFSVVYSSQCFYVPVLGKSLKEYGIPFVIGGPAVNHRLASVMPFLKDESDFVNHIASMQGAEIKRFNRDAASQKVLPDFSDFNAKDYLSRELVIPIKTSSTCFYQQCTFCTHFAKVPYKEYDIEAVRQTMIQSKARNFFFIDDMISKQRLLALAHAIKDLDVHWWVQLRPTRDLLGIFDALSESGCTSICWGLESGNQRVLDLIKKGTRIADVPEILRQSHAAGIKNTVYVMFGFPTETKDEFLDTINFLKDNQENLFMVSPTVFGLQKGAKVFEEPASYGITEIRETPRTNLGEKVEYTVASGLDKESARRLRGRFSKTLSKMNKAPQVFKDYKEQVLLLKSSQSGAY